MKKKLGWHVLVFGRKEMLGMLAGVVCIALGTGLLQQMGAGQWLAATSATHGSLRVVVDAGHGGFDGGAVRNQVVEAPLNLAVSFCLLEKLEQIGANVQMTRVGAGALGGNKKEDMRTRSKIFAQENIDFAISIHQNAHSNAKANGPAVFYSTKTPSSQKLAECVQNALVEELKIQKAREVKEGDFLLLNCAKVPAILVECGFLSNPQDQDNLQNANYQKRIAKAITTGLQTFLQEQSLTTPRPLQPNIAD